MSNFVARKLSDFLPDEYMDDYGYVWKKEQRSHTVEWVGYHRYKEIGSIILEYDNSSEAKERIDQFSWIETKVREANPEGIVVRTLEEMIINQYERSLVDQ